MFVLIRFDTVKNMLTVIDTDDKVSETVSIPEVIEYISQGIEIMGIACESNADKSNWSLTLKPRQLEDAGINSDEKAVTYEIEYDAIKDVVNRKPLITADNYKDVESECITCKDRDSDADDSSDTYKDENELTDGGVESSVSVVVDDKETESIAVTDDVDNSKTSDEVETSESDAVTNKDKKETETMNKAKEVEKEIKATPEVDLSGADNIVLESKPKRKKPTGKTPPKADKSVRGGILGYLDKLESKLDISIFNGGAFKGDKSKEYFVLDATCSDFVFFRGDMISIEIDSSFSGNFAVKDEILKVLSEVPFENKNGDRVNLYDVCCGKSDAISVYAPFSKELSVNEGSLRVRVNGLK